LSGKLDDPQPMDGTPQVPVGSPTDEFIPTRASLLHRLKNWEDQAGWRVFFNTYWRLIYSVACKAGLSDADAQDVVQDTMLSVAKKMPGFQYNPSIGSFKSWLMQIARRRITDQFRKRRYQVAGQHLPREERLDTAVAEKLPDPAVNLERIWDEEWERSLFEAALEKVKSGVDPLQFQIFHLHVIKKVDAKSVAQRLGVKLAAVYFAKYKISALITKEIRSRERQPL
jgi:RNA polymerase sigma factor (sigma-70 family)